jgi:topoisomerase-4 subunit A
MSKKKNNPNQEPDLFADMGDESEPVATAPVASRVVPNTADVDSLTLATYAERAYLD